MTRVSQNETRYEHVPRAEFERRLRDAGDMPEVSGLRRRADGHGGHPKYTYLGQGRRPYAVASAARLLCQLNHVRCSSGVRELHAVRGEGEVADSQGGGSGRSA